MGLLPVGLQAWPTRDHLRNLQHRGIAPDVLEARQNVGLYGLVRTSASRSFNLRAEEDHNTSPTVDATNSIHIAGSAVQQRVSPRDQALKMLLGRGRQHGKAALR